MYRSISTFLTNYFAVSSHVEIDMIILLSNVIKSQNNQTQLTIIKKSDSINHTKINHLVIDTR